MKLVFIFTTNLIAIALALVFSPIFVLIAFFRDLSTENGRNFWRNSIWTEVLGRLWR